MSQFGKSDWFRTWGYSEGTVEGEAAWAEKQAMDANFDPRSRTVIMSDISEFRSPVDGSVISSRSKLREHNDRNGVVQVGNDLRGSTPDVRMQRAGHDIKRALHEARN